MAPNKRICNRTVLSLYRVILCLPMVLLLLLLPVTASSMALDEAISLAKENLPSYKASLIRIKSTEALYKAALGPYLPSLDVSTSQKRFYLSSGEFTSRDYGMNLSYTLFDGGKRRANRTIALLNLSNDTEESRKNLIDLEYNVKVAFYTVLAQQESLAQKKVQLQDAQKDYEVAGGRHKLGVARLSDVLQASVSLEQARFNLVQTEGALRKAFSDLNSLIGYSLDNQYDIQGSLDAGAKPPDRKSLSEAAMQRPEVKQAENSLKISQNNKELSLSAFYPVISAEASYTKTGGSINSIGVSSPTAFGGGFTGFSPEEKIAAVTATWNIFELGKFFRYTSSRLEKNISTENLQDVKRQLLLNVHKTYEDFMTTLDQLQVAHQQLKQAEYNYSQAFGEYKVGKTDILSLVQAENLLSTARDQLINSRLNLVLSRSLLEKTAGIRWASPSPKE